MKTACSHCGAQHSLPESKIAGHARVQFRCAKCGKISVVEVADRPGATRVISPMPGFARSPGAPRLAGDKAGTGPRIPEDKAITLSVVSGPSRGVVYAMERARVVLGRADADLIVQDSEVSRWHCSVEVKDNIVRLRDLESTNGTYVGDERVRVAELQNLSEFRIGSTVVLVNIGSRQPVPSR